MNAATLTYSIHGRGISLTNLNYEQLQQFCRDRSLAIDQLISIASQNETHRKYRGYSISIINND
jgi:predicted DNA-binding ribbon-helix-helix protein